MTDTQFKPEPESTSFPIQRISFILAMGTGFIVVVTALGFYYFYPSEIGTLQPIPFSHRVHVTEKKLSCVICHSEVFDTDQAGIPPLETCMLCHSRIIIHQPKIAQLREHFFSNQTIAWNRISYLPDICFFSHQAHIHRGIDCGKCHGEIDKMDRVVLINNFKMGFCIQCHRDEGASHDCLFCHR